MELEFHDELPKAKRGTGRSSKWDPVVETLRANHRRWAVLLEGVTRSRASGVYRTLKSRYSDIEAATRTEGDGDTYQVWARAV